MKTHIDIKPVRNIAGRMLAGIFVVCLFALAVSAQAPPDPIPAKEAIPPNSLIIPMDNVNQGNAAGTTFNLRAYGLANQILHGNIPVKWAIAPGKSKDADDFAANVTRVAGSEGVPGPAVVSFSGGPFIVSQKHAAAVMTLITTFNSGPEADVTVYRTNESKDIDVRYNLNHKPKIAIGPDGGNFGAGVHQALFDSAGIGSLYYTTVSNDIIDPTLCYTLATQAHSTSAANVNLYRQFTAGGGNLLLQCASVGTFENDAFFGHFQTTLPGYSLFGTNAPDNAVDTTLLYPNGAMPFNQFIGILANQDGAITEYAFAPGGAGANGHLVAVQNSGVDADKFVATVSQLNGTSATGGVVFELGGHDYIRNNTSASLISRLNGQRMVLNAVFVPASRPCNSVQAGVSGYKSVRRIIPVPDGGAIIRPGHTVQWTIDYVNRSMSDISNFQVKDIIQPNLTLAATLPFPTVVTVSGTGTTAERNSGYTGIGIGSTSDLLLPGAFLPVNGRIRITVDMVVNINTPNPFPPNQNVLSNQTIASAPNLLSSTSLNSDNVDTTSIDVAGTDTTPLPGSVTQTKVVNSNDPTTFPLAPTAAAASIEGEVRTSDGLGIRNALIRVVNASTGVVKETRSNSFGHYRVEDLGVGELYLVTVQHKRYFFPNGTVTFTLSDSVTGLAFIGNLPETKGGREIVTSPVKGEKAGSGRQFRW